MVSETLVIAVATLGAGVVALIARLIYSSKCDIIKCGCCEVHRDIKQEVSLRNITGLENNINRV